MLLLMVAGRWSNPLVPVLGRTGTSGGHCGSGCQGGPCWPTPPTPAVVAGAMCGNGEHVKESRPSSRVGQLLSPASEVHSLPLHAYWVTHIETDPSTPDTGLDDAHNAAP